MFYAACCLVVFGLSSSKFPHQRSSAIHSGKIAGFLSRGKPRERQGLIRNSGSQEKRCGTLFYTLYPLRVSQQANRSGNAQRAQSASQAMQKSS